MTVIPGSVRFAAPRLKIILPVHTGGVGQGKSEGENDRSGGLTTQQLISSFVFAA
jgi:hypothetical protein